MAKLIMPLMSASASGKFAKSIVFFGWKGIAVARQLVIPANPQTADQGDQRIYMGGTGRSVGMIQKLSDFAGQLITLNLIPSGQTKQSYLVKYIIDHNMADGTAYASALLAYTNHTANADWESAGAGLGIVEFDLAYATVAPFPKGFGLYLIAKSAIELGFTGAPYTTALASWTSTEIGQLVSDMS